MIIYSWATFRRFFAVRAEAGPIPCTFLASGGGGPAIVRTDPGSFVTDGFVAGMSVEVQGTVDNNSRFLIDTVTTSGGAPGDQLTLDADAAVVAEIAFAAELDAFLFDDDGLEHWPLDNVRLAGSGFGDSGSTLTGIPAGTTYDGTTFAVTCNASAADAVAGAPEYDWYLSQRSDDPTAQYLAVTQAPDAGGQTFSGSIRVAYTALASAHFTFGTAVPTSTLRALFKHSHLYVRRRSDGAIQWVDLLAAMTGA